MEDLQPILLVVEDDLLVRLTVCHYLEGLGLVISVESGEAALHALKSERVDVVLTDLRLPDMNGLELERRASGMCPFVFMSGAAEEPGALPGPLLHKPFEAEIVRQVLGKLLRESAEPSGQPAASLISQQH